MKYNIGDIVECINNEGDCLNQHLTIGKHYKILRKGNNVLSIIDDSNSNTTWMSSRFILVSQQLIFPQTSSVPKVLSRYAPGDFVKYIGETNDYLGVIKGKTYIAIDVNPGIALDLLTITANAGKISLTIDMFTSSTKTAWATEDNVSLDSIKVNNKQEQHKCKCEFRDLLMLGCKCGGI